MLRALRERDYRLLFSGQTISYIGDQFHLIALPWLVLQLTHDPLQLGLVLAAAGIPRAALMLVGGAWADRFSPRVIMLVSDVLRAAVTAGLVFAIVSGNVQLWMVYVLAIAFGVVSGFFMPAAQAAIPRLLPDTELESGNALIMGADQLATFIGPVLAGTMIAMLAGAGQVGSAAAGLTGIAIAFAVDATSFLVSAITLALMRPLPGLGNRDTRALAEIADGLRFVADSQMLRWLVGIIALANLLAIGPLLVGIPVLAATRYSQGVTAFGVIVSAYALGNLGGMVGAGSLPRLSDRAFGLVAAALFFVFAAIYAVLGFVASMWVAAAMMVVAGLGNGYIAVLVMTALQRLAPKEMVGRVMSLVMLAMVGLAPISQALAGALVKLSAPGTFAIAGIGFAFVGVLAFSIRGVWRFPEAQPAENPASSPELEAA